MTWPQTLTLAFGGASAGDRPQAARATQSYQTEPIEIKGPLTRVKRPATPDGLDFISTVAADPGYGLFVIDPISAKYFSEHLADIKDENLRSVIWVNVLQNVFVRKLTPEYFMNLTLKMLPSEKNEQIIDMVLRNFNYNYWALLSAAERKEDAAAVEAMLWDRVAAPDVSRFARTSYFRAWESLFTSDEGWERLHGIWEGKQKIKDSTFSEADFMSMAYELILRRHSEASAITKEQAEKIKDPERQQEFLFVAPAAGGTQAERDSLFKKIITDDAVRKNEPWIRDALGYLHHPLNGPGSKNDVKESLEILPRIKQTGGIFFPLDWLNGNLAYHIDQQTRDVVDSYLKSHPGLEKGLRLKLLQAADILMRFTNPPEPAS